MAETESTNTSSTANTTTATGTPSSSSSSTPPPRLFHSSLHQIPLAIRFALSGILGNVFFVIVYNICLQQFQNVISPSAIYAVVQFACIIVNHALNCVIVFGFPFHYKKSLAQNMPVGLSALLLGAVSIKYLDRIQFDDLVERTLLLSLGITSSNSKEETVVIVEEEETKGFYASLVVMTITGLYSYVLLTIVNKPSAVEEKKKEKEL